MPESQSSHNRPFILRVHSKTRQPNDVYVCECVHCGKPVVALNGIMEWHDLKAVRRRGTRPTYAQHRACARKVR